MSEMDLKTCRPLNDIASIEQYAAERVDYVVATSAIVKDDLVRVGIKPEKIVIIHNAIEDYWFEAGMPDFSPVPAIVFLGRISEDVFTLKLKGVDRLVRILGDFPEIRKLSVVMSRNQRLLAWMHQAFPRHVVMANAIKDTLPSLLRQYAGGISLLPSRYEGFSLSLIETMSQGLVPVSYPVGVAPEIIHDGENGFLVKSIEEAKERIHLLLQDAPLRHRLAHNAWETSKRFHSDALVDEILGLYHRILNKKTQK